MQLRSKYFPYPVIVEGGDNYVNSSFESNVEQVMEGYNIKLILNAKLENDELRQMVKEGSVEIVHHIECPQTCYRSSVQTKEFNIEYLIKESDVNDVVQVCTFLIAKKDIEKYTNSLFSSDYQGFRFNLDKGCILAIGNQYNIIIDKIRDDLANTSSIFSIVPNIDPLVLDIKVDLSQNKIIIILPQQTYGSYSNMQTYMGVQKVMHSMIIIPALMYTFSELKEDRENLYNYEENRWFRGLKKACGMINVSLDEAGLINMDIYKTSQQLLNNPVSKAVEFLLIGGENYED